MPLDIVGAGMAGLLAGNMLRHHSPVIIEKQPELPNNHSAVLRFRTSVVGDVLGIPFKKVSMIKATLPFLNPVADALLYSFKNTGFYRSDRSISSEIQSGERYIAPPDFIARMAKNVKINFGTEYDHFAGPSNSTPCISTLPMPVLMKALDYPYRDKVDFGYIMGLNIRAKIDSCEAYVSLMVPDPQQAYSRVSITGNELVIEVPCGNFYLGPNDDQSHYAGIAVKVAVKHFGIPSVALHDIRGKRQDYAKIVPIDEDIRKDFIFWATDKHNVYSLGRFATWRPKLLLDDLVNDIRLIDRWIQRKDRYAIARHR